MRKWITVGRFQRQASASIANGGTTDLITEIAPSNMIMKLTHFGTYVAQLAAWGNLVWNVMDGNIKQYPFNDQRDQLGLQNDPLPLSESIDLYPGHTLVVRCNNDGAVAPGTYTGGAVIKGEYGYYV